MAARVQTSRFALLKVDDDVDSDSDDNKTKAESNKVRQQAAGAKKKKNKKKKAEQQKAENDELRNLAFGKGGKGKGSSGKQHAEATPPPAVGKQQAEAPAVAQPSDAGGDGPKKDWEQWKQRDTSYTSETYEHDLQQAMLLSKLDFEERTEVEKALADADGHTSLSAGGKEKKKKNKDKKAAMSLEQFKQMVEPEQTAQEVGSDEEWTLADESPSPKASVPIQESDPKFFKKVDQDVTKILQKERIQEEYRKQYVVENARSQQYQADIDKRDKEIAMLKEGGKKIQAELTQVKTRNKQLCHILGQGEMRDKREVLLELEDLKQVRDELTAEVTELTEQLEKERSKVHSLRAELDKVQGKPSQGGKSHSGKGH